MALVPIILSGGAGTRLWPLSRETAPKPFMPLPGDGANGDTLLARAFLRAAALPDLAGLVTITNRDYYFLSRDEFARYKHWKDELARMQGANKRR